MAAFEHQITELRRDAAGVLDTDPDPRARGSVHGTGKTAHLASALEERQRPRAAGASLEVLRQIGHEAWFPERHLRIPLHEHLKVVARRHLQHDGHRVALVDDGDLSARAESFRWLSLAIPSDLLVAGLAADTDMDPPEEGVLLVTPRLAEVLRRPCAETHLHAGAGIPFGLLWTAILRDIAAPPALRLPDAVGSPPFGTGKALTARLLSAAITRLLLAAFLRERGRGAATPDFAAFCRIYVAAISQGLWGLGEREAGRWLRAAHHHTVDPRPADLPADRWVERLRRLYQALIRGAPSGSSTIEAVISRDPLARWLPWSPGAALPETRFACHALRYLGRDGRDDGAFALTFWQYQRIRCLLYAYVVEEPGTAGLDWFTRHYARLSPLRRTLSRLTYASSLDLQSRDLHLGALEARTSPAPAWVEVRDEIRSLARAGERFTPRAGRARPEIGLVLHFIKEWKTSSAEGSRLHGDPRNRAFGARYGVWFHNQRQRALAMETAIRRHPEALLVLRGIDVANVELAVPTWPLLPLFHRVREASRRASARVARAVPSWEIRPLRVTVHAGEDFRRLMEGLRRIHEPLEFGAMKVGDRVGHAVALAEDPGTWMAASRLVPQPAEDRLDDLLWEMDRVRRGDIPADAGRVEWLRAEIVRLGKAIYPDLEPGVDELIDARRLRHDPEALAWLGYPFVRARPSPGKAGALLYRYLTDPGVFERGQAPVEVRAGDAEAAALRAAQRWLRGELGRREITVESNPSSNLLIADYLALGEHPAFRLRPLPGEEPVGPPVMLSLNTDNPITFSSNLADEFAYVYFALLGRGVPAETALSWLDRAREDGYLSRFTLRASADREALARVLAQRR